MLINEDKATQKILHNFLQKKEWKK